jgi:hypothetical protein
MRQVVGLDCQICHKRIGSILEGLICDECGNPVHNSCKVRRDGEPTACPVCGADLSTPFAREVQQELDQRKAAMQRHDQRKEEQKYFVRDMLLGHGQYAGGLAFVAGLMFCFAPLFEPKRESNWLIGVPLALGGTAVLTGMSYYLSGSPWTLWLQWGRNVIIGAAVLVGVFQIRDGNVLLGLPLLVVGGAAALYLYYKTFW